MTNTVYRLENITKCYGKRQILQINRLQIHRGETFTLVGPSGTGKSTLLRLLAMLEAPTSGDLQLNLTDMTYTNGSIDLTGRRRLGMVFQQPALLSRSVRHNIAYGLRLRGDTNWQTPVDKILRDVHLDHVADAPAHTLSGGEKQRVAIARALVLQPDVLILDEPTANLDPYNIRIIEERLADRPSHTTVIMVTHNIFQAKRLADRVALLLDGHLIETGSVAEFFDAPKDLRTAAFVNGDLIY
ncbi:MAG: phosphate ABC transporter ATP-binding protein [Chloroflexota bacterium]